MLKKRGFKVLFVFILATLISTLFAASAMAATVNDVGDNSMRVGFDVYDLTESNAYTYENVLDSLRRGGSQYYFKIGESWYDLLDDDIRTYEDLQNPDKALPPEIVRTWKLERWYCDPEDDYELFEPITTTYSFTYEPIDTVRPGEDIGVDVTFSTAEEGAVGYDGVRFKFRSEGPGDVTLTAVDSAGAHTFTNEGYWGPPGGFNLPANYSATTTWTLNFAYAGEYTITFSLVDAATDEIVDGITQSVVIDAVRTTEEAQAAFLASLKAKAEAITAARVAVEDKAITVIFDLNSAQEAVEQLVEGLLAAFGEEMLDASINIKLAANEEGETFNIKQEGAVAAIIAYLLGDRTPAQFLEEREPVEATYALAAKDKYNVDVNVEGALRLLHQYIVSFNVDDGSPVDDQIVDHGGKATAPEDPEKLGYTFDNWYADENFSILFDFDISITSDTTIYAKWTANQYP